MEVLATTSLCFAVSACQSFSVLSVERDAVYTVVCATRIVSEFGSAALRVRVGGRGQHWRLPHRTQIQQHNRCPMERNR
jgi:hypothetical protein